jgi:thiol-disulfide isomerase/thioredoxin
MKNKTRRVFINFPTAISMVFTLLISGAVSAAPQIEWQPPAFEIAEANGELFQYPQNLEGPTIILFWATWCPYCKALMPHLQSILDEYAGKLQVLALNFKDDDDPALYLSERGYDFRLILKSEDVAKSWGVKGTPGLFLADQTGRVVFSRGAIPKEAIPIDPDEDQEKLKRYQKAARSAPFWAAQLRLAIDDLVENQKPGKDKHKTPD